MAAARAAAAAEGGGGGSCGSGAARGCGARARGCGCGVRDGEGGGACDGAGRGGCNGNGGVGGGRRQRRQRRRRAVPAACETFGGRVIGSPDGIDAHRVILHSDMNAFYASVEQAERPELRGRPLVVGGREETRHGIVLAKSAQAKAAGREDGRNACGRRARSARGWWWCHRATTCTSAIRA